MNDDLKWLVENEHEWKEGAEYIGRSCMGYCLWFGSDDVIPAGVDSVFMKPQWQAARDELSGAPGWELAQEGARIRVQDASGEFFFGTYTDASTLSSGWTGIGTGHWSPPGRFPGRVLGDWRNTLEYKPETIDEEINEDGPLALYDAVAQYRKDHPEPEANPLRQFALSQIRAAADCCITDDDVREVFMGIANTLDDAGLASLASLAVRVVK